MTPIERVDASVPGVKAKASDHVVSVSADRILVNSNCRATYAQQKGKREERRIDEWMKGFHRYRVIFENRSQSLS